MVKFQMTMGLAADSSLQRILNTVIVYFAMVRKCPRIVISMLKFP